MKLRLSLLFAFLLSSTLFAQKVTVNGTVTNTTDVLYGVSITEKDTKNGTTTDFDGSYFIKVEQNATLVFSYMGYESQEILVTEKRKIDVALLEYTSKLEGVVITGFGGVVGQARRRAESIQDIPESVVTYTSEAIEIKGIENLKTFSDYIPNVNFTSSLGLGNNFITVRGISHIRNGEAPIAFVVDGVTLPDANLINQELFDIALIEVVKGPQGALYGKNAIAGAINILTNKPTNKFKNKVQVGYGSGNLLKGQLMTSGPIVKDKLFYRISASGKKGDGVIDNEALNMPVDFTEELVVRGQIRANFSDRTNLTVTGQVLDSKAGSSYFAGPRKDETPGDLFINASPDSFDNYSIVSDQFGESSLKGFYGNAKLEINLDDIKIVSSTTVNKADRNNFGDFDYTNVDALRLLQDSNSDTFNQEIKVSSVATDSKISWNLGAFYQNSDKLLFSQITADTGLSAMPPQPSGIQFPIGVGDFTNTYKTIAAFGFLDFKATDKLTFSFGLRFDNDVISQENISLDYTPKKSDSELQPKVSIAYKASDKTLLYTNYGRGYRNGGFNQDDSNGAKLSYDAELTDNFEFGIKNSFWDNRFILNASAYYIDFRNQQQFRFFLGTGGSVRQDIRNFEKSKSYGFELDVRLRPSKYFDIFAGYGLSTSEIVEGISRYSTEGTEPFSVAGKNTPFIPQSSFVIGLEPKINLSEKTQFKGNVLLKGTGDIYWHEDNNAVSSSYNLLNAKIGFTFSEKLSIFVWGNNILGEDYITEFFGSPFSNATKDLVWKGEPATFGLNLGYKF